MNDWTRVYKTSILSRAEIVKSVLQNHEIEAGIVNKKDSTIIIDNGQIEVMVPNEQALNAARIVKDEITFG